MTFFAGTPSDDVEAVLATGRGDVTTVFVSLSGRDPDGRDAEYIRWHTLDHRPEQHRLVGMRGSLRLVSTPECRAARASSTDRYDATDHVMTYLFSDPSAIEPFMALGGALATAGRMPHRLPSIEMGTFVLSGTVAAPRVVAGADVIPWRPSLGAYLLLERGASSADELCEVDGVAGVWWAARSSDDGEVEQVTFCFLDDDPIVVADRIRPVVERRWSHNAGVAPLLAAPFFSVVPFEWDRHLP